MHAPSRRHDLALWRKRGILGSPGSTGTDVQPRAPYGVTDRVSQPQSRSRRTMNLTKAETDTYHINLSSMPKVSTECLKLPLILVRKGHPPPLRCRVQVGRHRSRNQSALS